MTTSVLPPRTEREYQTAVIELALSHGWLVSHPWQSIHSPAGLPDLILVKAPRVIFAELKATNGRLSHAQVRWLTQLRLCPGVEVHL